MNFKNIISGIFALALVSVNAQQSPVWENFKSAQETGAEPILPDFSYAGYKYSEVPIPTVNYKVFNVVDFGAKPNDEISDKEALLKALDAAKKNGEGIIFFPKGKYYFFTGDDTLTPIQIKSSNIVFRGEGVGKDGSVLFFDKDLPASDPNKLWSVPNMIQTSASGSNELLTTIVADARRETKTITVGDASKIKKGDWVILEVENNSEDLIAYDIQPLTTQPKWTAIKTKGVVVNERHQVAQVKGNTIIFVEPIHYDVQKKHDWKVLKFAHLEHIGFENLTFEGNWTKDFVHHRSAQDDGGWSILNIYKCVNSWVKDCQFINVSNAVNFGASAACTALNVTIEGNFGHAAIHASSGSTGILMAKINDIAGMHHTTGVGGGSTTGTVVWRSKHAPHTCFESHASQPRCTLFDNVEGGFFAGRAGGAEQNLPNHGRYLVLWNYKETDTPDENFRFIATDTWFWKIVPPIVVGFHGAGTTFKEDEIQILESVGKPVEPTSLFEEQLKLRLGKLPEWLTKYNNYEF